jgi:hypothetical protein
MIPSISITSICPEPTGLYPIFTADLVSQRHMFA